VRVKFVHFAAFVSYMLVSYDGYGVKFVWVYEMCVGSWPIGRCGCDAMARAAIVPPLPVVSRVCMGMWWRQRLEASSEACDRILWALWPLRLGHYQSL
jgi:hypothetical protein